jgi:hypothetical protein
MSLVSNTYHGIVKTGLGVAGTLIVGVPTGAALLSASAAVLRLLGKLREEEQQTEPSGLLRRNVELLSPYNQVKITTSNLLAFAAFSAVLAVVAHKGLSCFGFGRRVLGDTSWLVRNVLPVQFAAPTFFGLCR